MDSKYEYKQRSVELDNEKVFRVGDGRISSYSSLTLGVLSLLAVLAYLFPSYLTTTELRATYDAAALQSVLKYAMYFSLFLGVMALWLNPKKIMALVGVSFTLIAFALGGYMIPVGPVEPMKLSLGVDWLILAFLGSVVIFTTLEKLFPKYKEQIILRDQWGLDLFYFTLNHLMISAIILFGNYHVSHFDWAVSPAFQSFVGSLPLLLQVAMIILVADFLLYWEHRMYHEVPKLWPIHAVHHSIENLDWLAGSRGHVIQVFSERAMVMIPLYILGIDKTVLDIYVTFAALQAIVIHCNISFSFGWFRYIFVTPQFHHWHHGSEDPAIDTNYSAHTVVFDRLFGTYHLPKEHWPAEYGTTKPLPRSYIGQTLYPFFQWIKR